MKLVLLGTGTPNAEPWANGPSCAVIAGGRAFLVDCGPGVVRGCTGAYYLGIDELRPDLIRHVFLTHLHSDHTGGLADLILTPWVLDRKESLHVHGPRGTADMVSHILRAYKADIDYRIDGPEPISPAGIKTIPHEIHSGMVYADDHVVINAYWVSHGLLESFAYVFLSEGKKIVISGDTTALENMKSIAEGADILVHEAEYTAGLAERSEDWQNYHRKIHTMSTDLADIINAARPKLTITTHRILHLNYYGDERISRDEIEFRENELLKEITGKTDLTVVNGHDLDVYEC